MRFPLQLIPHKTHFDFMKHRWWAFGFSIIGTITTIALLAVQGVNWGVDFTGGVLMEIHTEQPQHAEDLGHIREALNELKFGEVMLQEFGSDHDLMIRIEVEEGQEQSTVINKVKETLSQQIKGTIDYRRIDYVGPTVGDELKQSAAIALLLSLLSIMGYVWFRFEWQYGVGAIAALVHDAVMTMGFYSVTGYDFGLTAVAAILTILGYSINDSVVIYDRIRETMRKYKKMDTIALLNTSINDTLARTTMTAGTVLLACLALYIFGGEVIEGFAAAMLFGTVIGTYSSIFISAPVLVYLNLRASVEETPLPARP